MYNPTHVRPWRNWQTLRTKDPVGRPVIVQVYSGAPSNFDKVLQALTRYAVQHFSGLVVCVSALCWHGKEDLLLGMAIRLCDIEVA